MALGNSATFPPPVNFSPRTPVGPSEKAIGARPIESSPHRVKAVSPVSRRTLVRRSSRASSAAYGLVVVCSDMSLHFPDGDDNGADEGDEAAAHSMRV